MAPTYGELVRYMLLSCCMRGENPVACCCRVFECSACRELAQELGLGGAVCGRG